MIHKEWRRILSAPLFEKLSGLLWASHTESNPMSLRRKKKISLGLNRCCLWNFLTASLFNNPASFPFTQHFAVPALFSSGPLTKPGIIPKWITDAGKTMRWNSREEKSWGRQVTATVVKCLQKGSDYLSGELKALLRAVGCWQCFCSQ